MKIILISGKARSGKDTVAEFIKETLQLIHPNKTVGIIHYADELKYILKQYYDWDDNKDEKGRTLLQETGDKVRKSNKDYFVNRAIQQAKIIDPDFLIIPDARYKNEINTWFYRGYNPLLIRIERNDNNALTKKQNLHSSECELDKYNFDYYIQNDNSLQELKFQCGEVVKQWLM